jgi:hypothetical protein
MNYDNDRFYRNNKFCIRLYLYISYIVLLFNDFLNKIENIRNRQAVSSKLFYFIFSLQDLSKP